MTFDDTEPRTCPECGQPVDADAAASRTACTAQTIAKPAVDVTAIGSVNVSQ